MKGMDCLEQYSQAIEMAENRVSEFKNFCNKYKLEDSNYFLEKLTSMGYDAQDVSTILINKDLLLSMYMNSFKNFEIEAEDIKAEIDTEIEEVRKKYINAVDNANQSIANANEARNMMMALRELIEKEHGFDSNNWDSKSVHQMNEAIAVYNRLVDKANKDTELCVEARSELARVRNECSNKLIVDVNEDNSKTTANENNLVLETS